MTKNKFIKEVLSLCPEFENYNNYFYFKEYAHILSGFFYEKTSKGAYIGMYAYPLFDGLEGFHLGYGQRFIGHYGYIDFSEVESKLLPTEFTKRISKHYDAAHEMQKLVWIEKNINNHKSRLEIFYHRRSYAVSLILRGKPHEAHTHLEQAIILAKEATYYDLFAKETEELLSFLKTDLLKATQLIRKWEENKMNEFSLKPIEV